MVEYEGNILQELFGNLVPISPPSPEVFYPLLPSEDSPQAPWPPRLTFDIALGLEREEVLAEHHGLTTEQFNYVRTHPAFRKEIDAHRKEITEKGLTFQAKAKLQAEMYLEEIHDMVTDPLVATATKHEMIKSVVKWAGYEGPAGGGEKGGNSPQFNIQINLGG